MMIFGFQFPPRGASLMRRLTLGALLAAPWCGSPLGSPAGAAEPNTDPQVDWLRDSDPEVELLPPRMEWSPELEAIWLKTLEHDESDLRREAADTITRAHQLGMPGSDALIDGLMHVLQSPDEHPVARTAAARALVALDARRAAPLLAEHARRGPIELSLLVEPALAQWDFQPAREIWLERLASPSTPSAQLQLALECLGRVAESAAAADLQRLALSETTSAMTRLAAARALAKLPASGLVEIARRLAVEPTPETFVARLVGAHLLAQQSGDETLELLDHYAAAPEPTIAAQAMQRLLEIAPERLVERAPATIVNPDARVRELTVRALATAPTEMSIATLTPVLDDGVPAIRHEARRILLEMSARDELRPVVIEHAERTLDGDAWRGIEQAILILTELDQRQIGERLLQLLHHERSEAYVTAAWSLKTLAIPELADRMFEEAQRLSEPVSKLEGPDKAHLALAHLLEALGPMDHQPAEEFMRIFIPKEAPFPVEARAAAIWAIGFLWADAESLDPELVAQLEQRLNDANSIPAEWYDVRVMSAVALGRMKAEDSLPSLRHWYAAEGVNSYLGRCCGWAIERMTGEPVKDPVASPRQLQGWFVQPLSY